MVTPGRIIKGKIFTSAGENLFVYPAVNGKEQRACPIGQQTSTYDVQLELNEGDVINFITGITSSAVGATIAVVYIELDIEFDYPV